MQHALLQEFETAALKVFDHLHQEFAKLQTGRANAALLETIMVDAYGQKMEMKGVASISVQDARSMLIQPWDKSVLSAVEKAIQMADIGVNPVNDGIAVRLNFPPMTEERRKGITKIVSQLTEQAKIAIRQDRQKVNDVIKELDDEDEVERLQKDLQKLVDEANATIEEAAKKKQEEVMTV
jgi:ribosome recycling factor